MKRLLLCLLPIVAFAAGSSATVSWVAPTAYTDSSALPAGDIAFYTLTWDNGGSVKVTGLQSLVTIPCGSTHFSVTVTTTATAAYPNATSSAAGPIPYATGIACAPNPPSGLAAH